MKSSILALALLSSLAVTGRARAGTKGNTPVAINTSLRAAWGDMGSARNSADGFQQLGCSYNVFMSGTTEVPYISCSAMTATGQYASCYVTDPSSAFLEAIRALNSDSYLQFWWDESGRCNRFHVLTTSINEPKKP